MCVDSGEEGTNLFHVFCQLIWVGTCLSYPNNNSSVPEKPAVRHVHLEGGPYPMQQV